MTPCPTEARLSPVVLNDRSSLALLFLPPQILSSRWLLRIAMQWTNAEKCVYEPPLVCAAQLGMAGLAPPTNMRPQGVDVWSAATTAQIYVGHGPAPREAAARVQ